MSLNDLLKVPEDVFLIEGSFEGLELNLKTLDYLDKLRYLPQGAVEAAAVVRDKTGIAIGAAFKNRHPDGDFWFLLPYPHPAASRRQTEAIVSDILGSGLVASTKHVTVDPGRLWKAVREYLSISLLEGALCDCTREKEPLSFAENDARGRRIRSLMRSLARRHGYDLKKIAALEICCGNGMSTVPLRSLFKDVLSVDNDRCAICNGLFHGTLLPESTMVADAMELSRYGLGRFGAVTGFMLGTIYEFNKPVWRAIFQESLRMLEDDGFLLFTVNKKEEVDFVAESYASMGVRGEVIDNRQNGCIYDSCAFFAVPVADRSNRNL